MNRKRRRGNKSFPGQLNKAKTKHDIHKVCTNEETQVRGEDEDGNMSMSEHSSIGSVLLVGAGTCCT